MWNTHTHTPLKEKSTLEHIQMFYSEIFGTCWDIMVAICCSGWVLLFLWEVSDLCDVLMARDVAKSCFICPFSVWAAMLTWGHMAKHGVEQPFQIFWVLRPSWWSVFFGFSQSGFRNSDFVISRLQLNKTATKKIWKKHPFSVKFQLINLGRSSQLPFPSPFTEWRQLNTAAHHVNNLNPPSLLLNEFIRV